MSTDTDNVSLVKLPVDDSIDQLVVCSTWESDNIQFQIIDLSGEGNEWIGKLLIDDLKVSAEELEISFDEFYIECKLALCTDGGLENFCYSIKDGKFIFQKNEQYKVTYGEISLLPEKGLRNKLILDFIHILNNLKKNLQTSKLDFHSKNVELQTFIKSYEKCVKEKNLLEREMLTKFSVLLNSKKDKIAELEQLLIEKETKITEQAEHVTVSGSMRSTSDEDTPSQEHQITQKIKLLPKRQKIQEQSSELSNTKLPKRITIASCTNSSSQISDDFSELPAADDPFDTM